LAQVYQLYPKTKDMVLISHSMGGLLSQMQAVTTKRVLWDDVFKVDADRLYAKLPADSVVKRALILDANPPRSAARLLRKRGTPDTMGRCALTQDILQLHIRRDREEWPRTAAEAITAPPFKMGLPRTETGPAPNPEEIPH
jgi:hypothetical protein